jgi:UrcA family protein
MRGLMTIALGSVALLATTAPSHAQDWRDREWRQIRVDASALDLSTPAGIDVLAARIDKAVNRICGSDRLCRDEAWASTEEQVAWAIGRDEWMRRMAEERIAQVDSCGERGCGPAQPRQHPTYFAASPQPAAGVTVTIIYTPPAEPRGW